MSAYVGFDVFTDNGDGTTTPAAGATVHAYNVTGAAALADLTADGSGHVAAGTYAIAVGSTVRFWVDLGQGRVAFAEQVTT